MESNIASLTDAATGLIPKDATATVITVPISHGSCDPWSMALLFIPVITVMVLVALYIAGVRGNKTTNRIQALPSVMKTFLIVAMLGNSFALLQSVAGKLELWMRLDSSNRSMILASGLALCLREYAWSLLLLVIAIPAIAQLRRVINR